LKESEPARRNDAGHMLGEPENEEEAEFQRALKAFVANIRVT
jgi:hypothetical protein